MKNRLPTISHAKGRGQMNHNNRTHTYSNVDQSRTKDNVTYVKESLDVAYEKCYGEAQRAYDVRQKRQDRKINDYYSHLFGEASKLSVAEATKGQQSYYEMVIGIGDKDTCPVGSANGEVVSEILDEYMNGFRERNPGFYVFNAVKHMDEKTPHIHLNYLPVATGYEKGMVAQNGHAKALEKMGYGNNKMSINKWRKNERSIIRDICKKHNFELAEEKKGRGKTFTPDEFKQIRDEAKEELKSDLDIMYDIKEELRADVEEELLSEQQYLVNEIFEQKQAVSSLKDEKTAFQNELDRVEGKRRMLEAVKAYTATPSKLNKDNVVIPVIQYNDLKKTAIEGAQNTRQLKELREKKKSLDGMEQTLNDREVTLSNKEASLDGKLKRANDETKKYKQLYNQERHSTSGLIAELSQQKGETKRWESNYNNLYNQHVKLKRSKGLEI